MGERGTGKSLVLRSVIRQLREDHPLQPLTEVYLSGFCVRDDSAALREIARQLHRASGGGGPADGAARAGAEAAAAPAAAPAAAAKAAQAPRTFAESMAELRTALQQSMRSAAQGGHATITGRPIILVLDEFDQFAAQNRQMLLYNLYNLIHDAGSRVAIVGVTSCLDATDHLEKRVKSRFSQRTLRFPPLQKSADFIQMLQNALQLPTEPPAPALAPGSAEPGGATPAPAAQPAPDASAATWQQYARRFNVALKLLLRHPTLTAHLHQMAMVTSDARAFLHLGRVALAQLTLEQPFLRVDGFCTFLGGGADASAERAAADGQRRGNTAREMTLLGLNRLELILVVAMTRLVKRGVDCFNFERVYDEYQSWVGRDNSGPSGRAIAPIAATVDRKEAKGTVMIAWERLMQQDLVAEVEGTNGAAGVALRSEYRMARLLVAEVDAGWVVREHGDSNDELRRWLDRTVPTS